MSLNIVELQGKIKVVTGLHIGAGNDDIHIGGIDNPVVKDVNGYPYIPGSSLKGKIRSLLEMSEGICYGGKPSTTKKSPDSLVPVLFGDTEGNITRVLFRDSFLSKDSRNMLIENSTSPTESKSENSINRFSGKAENPRVTERVIPGLVFDFSIVVRLLDGDSEADFKATLLKGFRLLEKDALGGSGSRGYGKVEFSDLVWNGESLEL